MKKIILCLILLVSFISIITCDDEETSSDPVRRYILSGNGGDGASGNGGIAGTLNIVSFSDLSILKNGSVNTSFSIPGFTENLGEVPLVITGNTTLSVYTSDPGAGVPYLYATDNYIRISDGDGNSLNDNIVTGLKVSKGATLTLELNNGSTTSSTLDLENDVIILGRVTTLFQASPNERNRVYLVVTSGGRFFTGSGSFIELTGADATNPADSGGMGGYFNVTADDDIIIQSRINMSGGDGAAGGTSPPMVLISLYRNIFIRNEITMNGGNGTLGPGGNSNYLQATATFGDIKNSADITMNGGDSVNGNGGNGGYLSIMAGPSSIGSFYNSGTINASGGSSENGNGGSGAAFSIVVHGDELLWSGTLTARGGDGLAGGNGASIAITSASGTSVISSLPYACGAIRIGASIILDGGNGTTNGGNGGSLVIGTTGPITNIIPPSNPIEFVRYSSMNFTGGNGGTNGGMGAPSIFLRTMGFTMISGEIWDAGALINQADFNASGGNGTLGTGGAGGIIQFDSSTAQSEMALFENTGNINTEGGSGNNGANSGLVNFVSYREMKNSGDITVTGGNATGNTAIAGVGSPGITQMVIAGYGDITNRGDIYASGGDATGTGSTGGGVGAIYLWAADVVYNYGRIYASGGTSTNGTSSLGGLVELRSGLIGETVNSASIITVQGGPGATPLSTGTIIIDLLDVTPADGTLP